MTGIIRECGGGNVGVVLYMWGVLCLGFIMAIAIGFDNTCEGNAPYGVGDGVHLKGTQYVVIAGGHCKKDRYLYALVSTDGAIEIPRIAFKGI